MTRHRLAVFALVIIPLATSLWFLLDVIPAYSNRSNAFGVAAFESRFEILHKTLALRSVLGYVSDGPAASTQAQAEFYLTEYVLAPAIVKASPDEQLVVGNFHTNSPDQKLLQAKNLVPVQNFGNGVFLLRNTSR